jgi:hypothetical protein
MYCQKITTLVPTEQKTMVPSKKLLLLDFLQTPHIQTRKYINHQVLHILIFLIH